jgi:hypothetical protein
MPVLKNRNTGGTSVSTPSAWLWFQNGIASPPETEWQLVAADDVRKLRANVSDQPAADIKAMKVRTAAGVAVHSSDKNTNLTHCGSLRCSIECRL